MNNDNEPSAKNGYSIASFILSATSLAILMIGFLFCFIFSRAGAADNGRDAIWWVFIALLWLLIPLTIIANIPAMNAYRQELSQQREEMGARIIMCKSISYMDNNFILLLWIC